MPTRRLMGRMKRWRCRNVNMIEIDTGGRPVGFDLYGIGAVLALLCIWLEWMAFERGLGRTALVHGVYDVSLETCLK